MIVYGYLYIHVNSQVGIAIYSIIFLKHVFFSRHSKLVGRHGAGEVFLVVEHVIVL